LEEIRILKSGKSSEEYKLAFNEFLNHVNKENASSKGEYVKKMIQLIKETCLTQLKLETILDNPIKLSQLIKNKGKKLLNDDIKTEAQNKLLKYVNILVKPDFISSHLATIPIEELAEVIRMLESQQLLVIELK
jgi:YesN/AraC family two-component response regulator